MNDKPLLERGRVENTDGYTGVIFDGSDVLECLKKLFFYLKHYDFGVCSDCGKGDVRVFYFESFESVFCLDCLFKRVIGYEEEECEEC